MVLHELTHEKCRGVLGEAAWRKLISGVENWSRSKPGSTEHQIYLRAMARAIDSRTTGDVFSEELFAYAVETAVQMGVRPSAEAHDGSAAHWLALVVDGLKSVVRRLVGHAPSSLTPQEVVDLSFGLAQIDSPARSKAVITVLDSVLLDPEHDGPQLCEQFAPN